LIRVEGGDGRGAPSRARGGRGPPTWEPAGHPSGRACAQCRYPERAHERSSRVSGSDRRQVCRPTARPHPRQAAAAASSPTHQPHSTRSLSGFAAQSRQRERSALATVLFDAPSSSTLRRFGLRARGGPRALRSRSEPTSKLRRRVLAAEVGACSRRQLLRSSDMLERQGLAPGSTGMLLLLLLLLLLLVRGFVMGTCKGVVLRTMAACLEVEAGRRGSGWELHRRPDGTQRRAAAAATAVCARARAGGRSAPNTMRLGSRSPVRGRRAAGTRASRLFARAGSTGWGRRSSKTLHRREARTRVSDAKEDRLSSG
jgi:hypothetical protein